MNYFKYRSMDDDIKAMTGEDSLEKYEWENKEGKVVNMLKIEKSYLENLISYLERIVGKITEQEQTIAFCPTDESGFTVESIEEELYDKRVYHKSKLKEAKEARQIRFEQDN